MPLGYRSIFTVSAEQDPVRVAAEQFRSWLRHKRCDADNVTPGVHDVAEGVLLAVTELRPQDGSHALRYRLTESTPTGEWTTTITARASGRERGWIWVDVNAPPYKHGDGYSSLRHDRGPANELESAEDPKWTAVPRLVRDILSVAEASDGDLILSGRPTRVGSDELGDLIAAICDPERRGSALVASPIPGEPMPLLIGRAEEITRQSVGLAGMYVLEERAAQELQRSFGQLHAVPPGAIRTYLPGVDPASAVDARRHRILLASTIATQPAGKLSRTLGWANRNRALSLPLPKHVSRVDRILSREEPATALRSIHAGTSDRHAGWAPPAELIPAPGRSTATDSREAVREATHIAIEAAREAEAAAQEAVRTSQDVVSAPVEEAATAAARDVTAASELLADLVREFAADVPGQPAARGGAALVGRLRRFLAEGRSALRSQQELSRRVAGLQDTLEETEDDRDMARARLEEEQLDHAGTQYELLHLKAEADRLRGALAAAGRPEDAWTAPAEAPQPPGSFAELLERLENGALPRIAFTGEPKNALDLDDHDPLGTWASKTWDVLRVLDGYVEARQSGEFTQGVHVYLSQTPPGRPGYSSGAHASQESDTVENSAKFRKLRTLPVPAEVCTDGSLFMGAHFRIAMKGMISPRMHYHDDVTKTGKVYVGYIGKHLPNKQTN
jgi:hypothetical protein